MEVREKIWKVLRRRTHKYEHEKKRISVFICLCMSGFLAYLTFLRKKARSLWYFIIFEASMYSVDRYI